MLNIDENKNQKVLNFLEWKEYSVWQRERERDGGEMLIFWSINFDSIFLYEYLLLFSPNNKKCKIKTLSD